MAQQTCISIKNNPDNSLASVFQVSIILSIVSDMVTIKVSKNSRKFPIFQSDFNILNQVASYTSNDTIDLD